MSLKLSIEYLPWGAEVREARSVLKNVVQEIIDDHIRTFDPNNLRDYVDTYLLEMKNLRDRGELEKSSFTMDRLLGISMNMTMEGTDSVGESISNLLTEASKHLEEQKKVQKELDSVVGKERLPSMLDRPKLPYLEAFIQELFRTAQAFYNTTHYSIQNLHVFGNYYDEITMLPGRSYRRINDTGPQHSPTNRVLIQETTIQGYRIPKRSIIVGNLWSINNDPETFPKPSEFDPSRFLGENGEKLAVDGPVPFSMEIASLMQITVQNILSSYDILVEIQKRILKFLKT
ncbi:UNVERIFIED_CONTAM: Cyp2u1 [Trichonephila clavipes]